MSYIPLDEAISGSFHIDESCYPWVAYKGARFNPTEWHYTETATEFNLKLELYNLRDRIKELYDYSDSGTPK